MPNDPGLSALYILRISGGCGAFYLMFGHDVCPSFHCGHTQTKPVVLALHVGTVLGFNIDMA